MWEFREKISEFGKRLSIKVLAKDFESGFWQKGDFKQRCKRSLLWDFYERFQEANLVRCFDKSWFRKGREFRTS